MADPVLAASPQVRPWVRCWARYVDIGLAYFVIEHGVGLAFPELEGPTHGRLEMLLGMGAVLAWMLVEAGLLSLFGSTPGKWLLNVSVRKSDGTRPTCSQAFERCFLVWWRGLGIGFPVVTLITQMVAYGKLMGDGITTWDRDAGFRVRHRKVGVVRTLCVVGWFAVVDWRLLVWTYQWLSSPPVR